MTVPILVTWDIIDPKTGKEVPKGVLLPELVMVPAYVYNAAYALDGVDSVSDWLSDIFGFLVREWRRV